MVADMTLDEKDGAAVAPTKRAMLARKLSRRAELIVGGITLAIIILFALTHREPAKGAAPNSPSAASSPARK